MNLDSMQWQLAWFLAAWLFYFGACVGSFLNVVIYRLPAGLALAKPNSRCPECLHPIRWYDNLPIISWLRLGAQCRDCAAPIPARYPFVELLMGAMFLCLGVFEGLSVGANLPTTPATLFSSWLVCAAHAALLSVLVAAAFIQFDGHRPPSKLFGFALIVGLGMLMVEPSFVPHQGEGFQESAILTSLAGCFAGGFIGLAITSAASRFQGGWSPILPWLVVGQFLGWQAVCWIVILATLFVATRAWTRGSLSQTPTLGVVAAVTLTWIVCWSPIVATWPQWTSGADASLMAIAVMFAAALGLIENRSRARSKRRVLGVATS